MPTTYATLTELKYLNGIPATGDDTLLQLMLDTAADLIDGYCGTQFTTGTATSETYSGDGGRVLWLKHRPAISITSVVVDDDTLSSSEYELVDYRRLVIPEGNAYNPRLRAYEGCWAVGTNNIEVTYTYGYAAVPNPVKVATALLAAHLYHRQSNAGVASERMGPRSIAYTQDDIPGQVRALLNRYIEPKVRG